MPSLERPLRFAHTLARKVARPGDYVIDATCGNGKDASFLVDLVAPDGHVYGFDIQKSAIDKTRQKLLKEDKLSNVTLFLAGHENIKEYIDKKNISVVMYNLGYLPGGDHSIMTVGDTTVLSLKQSLESLRDGGIITIVLYTGHNGGLQESKQVVSFLENIDQEEYTVLNYRFINQVNNPPQLIAIEKKT